MPAAPTAQAVLAMVTLLGYGVRHNLNPPIGQVHSHGCGCVLISSCAGSTASQRRPAPAAPSAQCRLSPVIFFIRAGACPSRHLEMLVLAYLTARTNRPFVRSTLRSESPWRPAARSGFQQAEWPRCGHFSP